MIIACPSCGTRYRVGDAAIPAAGRLVRCQKCGNSWRETNPDIDAGSPPEAAPAAPDGDVPPSDSGELPGFRVESGFEPEPSIAGERFVIPAKPAVEPDRRASRRLMVGWLALAAVVVLLLAGLGLFKDGLVTAWPPAARFYAAIGWPSHIGSGLQLSQITVSPATSNGQPILVLSGKIADISRVALSVPKLHVYLLGDNQKVLRRLELNSGTASLRPGESAEFKLNIDDPPTDAASVRVALATP